MTRRAAALALLGILALAGCSSTPGETPQEERYLNAVYTEAKEQGTAWTKDIQESALDLGHAVCRDLAKGLTLDQIRADAQQEDPRTNAVVQAGVTAAPVHLCPEEAP